MIFLPNAASYLAPITEIERASQYPYLAPTGGYILDKGKLYTLDQIFLDSCAELLFDGRTPVLSVGSNRAPSQLFRKFGSDASIPVTPAILHDCDVVHTAYIGYYAAVPCTAFPSIGTKVELNIAWLDAKQLIKMHKTEGVGTVYDFVRITGIEHQLDVPEQPVYAYVSCFGALDFGDSQPAALAAIDASEAALATLEGVDEAIAARRRGTRCVRRA